MTAQKKLQFRLNIKHATSREQGYFKWVTICALFKMKRFIHTAPLLCAKCCNYLLIRNEQTLYLGDKKLKN